MKTYAMLYWLIPGGSERDLFRELIRILAHELGAPRFEPHLTICATADDGRDPREALERITSRPIRLKVAGTHYSEHFTKTLFIRFQRNRQLDLLNLSLCGSAQKSAGILCDPHLSLLYKRMSIAAKKELASTIKLSMKEVLFDSIRVVRCASPTVNRADVEAWELVAARSLIKAGN